MTMKVKKSCSLHDSPVEKLVILPNRQKNSLHQTSVPTTTHTLKYNRYPSNYCAIILRLLLFKKTQNPGMNYCISS